MPPAHHIAVGELLADDDAPGVLLRRCVMRIGIATILHHAAAALA